MNSYGPVKPDLLTRLSRIEGQVRGIRRMVEEDKYCIDIVTQVNAARRALESMGLVLLEAHAKGCVRGALTGDSDHDGDAMVDELAAAVSRFVRG
jgi:CsoR family transcriptional regulator, copper-sensing transcriptional repressor